MSNGASASGSKSWARLIVVVAVVAAAAVVIILYLTKRPVVVRGGHCGEPPQAIVTSKMNLDAAVKGTVAVFRGQIEDKVVDVIPVSARNAQVFGYLACVAKEQNLISTPEDAKQYLETLGCLSLAQEHKAYSDCLLAARGRPPDPLPKKAGPLFKSVRVHFASKVPREEFELVLPSDTDKLDRFWIGEVSDKTWTGLFAKICHSHVACLTCQPPADQIVNRVEIRITGSLKQGKSDEGAVIYRCASENPQH